MKRITALCLAAVLLILSLFSCRKKGDDASETDPVSESLPTATVRTEPETADPVPTETTGTETAAIPESQAPETTAETQTPDRWDEVAAALAGTDPEQRTIRVALDASANGGTTGERNPRLIAGPDEIGDETPGLDRAVYERNRTATERLGVRVEYAYWDEACGGQAQKIKALVESRDATAPDLFVSPLTDLWSAAFAGCFSDYLSRPGSYLDFGSDGWLTDYMTSLSLSGDRAYILAGDAFPDLFRGTVVLPVNLTMADAEATRLLPCLSSDAALGAGETFSTRFFDQIEAGEWTYETLAALSEAIFRDTGETEGQDDLGDLLGLACDAGEIAANSFLYSSGATPLTVSTDGKTGKVRLGYSPDAETLGALFDAVSRLFDGTGVLATAGGETGENGEHGSADCRRKFVGGTMLFAGAASLGSFACDEYRTMSDRFFAAPLPKVQEADDYRSPILPDADAGAVNRNTAAFPAVTAYLQVSAENSRTVRDGYLSALTRPEGTGENRMLGLILGAIRSGRDEMIDAAVSGDGAPAWAELLAFDGFRMTSAMLAERYDAVAAVKAERLDRLIKEWYSLPESDEP